MKAIERHFKEYESFYYFVFLLVLVIGCLTIMWTHLFDLTLSIKTKEELVLEVKEYEKILEREFGQTFNSYNEYLVYKIENGGVN